MKDELPVDIQETEPVVTTQLSATEPAPELISDYQEKYRSQYHFSPPSGWIGDPDGCIYYNGEYHVFWWGKAKSKDLVHFEQVTVGNCFALIGDPGQGDYYTGGAVIDKNNTAGFGENKMVAVYTIPGEIQKQGISYSIDDTFDSLLYYPGNPVLEREGTADFRDPCVFWDEENGHWVMAIAVSAERKIAFYSSPDLKQWTWLSDFGPLGAREGVWECPDLFKLKTDTGEEKWVLIVSMGPNKEQYFVGKFDGISFIPDDSVMNYLTNGIGMDGQLFAGFDSGGFDNWTPNGKAFEAPCSDDGETFHLGEGYINSGLNGNSATGTLTSPEFTIEKNAINFLIGSNKPSMDLALNLLVDGEVVRSTFGDSSGFMRWNGWDVSDLVGKKAQLQIVDAFVQGCVTVDQIMFSDLLHNDQREHALWVDYGADFYASRIFRDYDNTLQKTSWIGWMGNWDYANRTPVIQVEGFNDQRGTYSVARDLSLTMVNGLPRLIQTPVAGLSQLRGDEMSFSGTLEEGISALPEFKPASNTYEFEAVFTPGDANSEFGFNLLVGDGRKLTLGYQTATGTLYLDRRNCADQNIPSFKRYMTTAVDLVDGKLSLHVFVDKQSIEIFANDGQNVMTALTFPAEDQVGVELFTDAGNTHLDFSGWMLDSIWPGNIQTKPEFVNDTDERMLYDGNWQTLSDDTYFGGDCHVSDSGSVSMTFVGTSVDWYGLVSSDLGIADVYIDGQPVLQGLDLYSPVTRRQKLFSKTELTPGSHTIQICATGEKNPKSTGNRIVHDTFVYCTSGN